MFSLCEFGLRSRERHREHHARRCPLRSFRVKSAAVPASDGERGSMTVLRSWDAASFHLTRHALTTRRRRQSWKSKPRKEHGRRKNPFKRRGPWFSPAPDAAGRVLSDEGRGRDPRFRNLVRRFRSGKHGLAVLHHFWKKTAESKPSGRGWRPPARAWTWETLGARRGAARPGAGLGLGPECGICRCFCFLFFFIFFVFFN